MRALVLTLSLAAASPALAQTFYVTDQQGGVARLDGNTLQRGKDIDTEGKGPRGIAVTQDGKFLVTANQGTGDLSLLDRASGVLQTRIPIGPSAEMVRVLGHTAYVTYEPPGEKNGLAHIAIVDLDAHRVVTNIPSGHETEGLEFSADGKQLLVTNEGDNTISIYALPAGQLAQKIKVDQYGTRPRGIKRTPDGTGYVVSLEFSDHFIVIDHNLAVTKSVATAAGPYGLAFSPDGKTLWVAAAKAGQLQAFDAATYAHVADVPVGKRCWHFAFAPDGKRIVAACGRSGALYVVDTSTMKPAPSIEGFKMPWGIVSYPATNGSLQTK